MSNKNEVLEYLIDQLRQQVTSNPYKQQCEDLAHEVQSLKNQLRDMSELVDELMGTITLMNGDVEAYKVLHKGGFIPKGKSYVVGEHAPAASVNCRCTPAPILPEQSGCRKEDTQECFHNWRFVGGKSPAVCINCGVTKPEECEHDFIYHGSEMAYKCIKCGAIK